MIRILIVDDHCLIREGITKTVSETDDIHVAGEAANGAQALSLIEKNHYDVILLDISMPGRDGLDVLKQIRMYYSDLAVLILTMYPAQQYAVRLLKAGASGYLSKESVPDELCTAIRTVASDRKYISPELAEILASDLHGGMHGPLHQDLSDREYQVMILLASGKQIKDIAMELSLSAKTVSTYLRRILEKMHLDNQLELVRYALKNKLVD